MIRDQELAGLAMTLGRDAKIKITVGGDSSYCKPDGSHINIARMPSTPLGRMLMTGLVFHEIGHKNYTKGTKPDGLLGDMMNVIEDIRVETAIIKERPGTRFNLEAVTTHYVQKGSLTPKELTHALLGKVLAYGRGRILKQSAILPLEVECNGMMDEAFGLEFIDDVEAIIKDIPKLRTTMHTTVMARKLIDLLISQAPPAPQPQQSSNTPQRPKDGRGQQDDGNTGCHPSQQTNHGAGSQSTEPPFPKRRDIEGQAEPKSKGCDSETVAVEDAQQTGYSGNGAGTGGGKRPTREEIEELLKTKTGYGDLSELIQSELDEIANKAPKGVKAVIPGLPEVGRLKPSHGKLNEIEAISASSRMRARLLGMLQSIKRQPKAFGLSGRKLAVGRLVKLAAGDPRIFKKKVESVAVNTAVMVLLDLSGSMSGKYEVANASAFSLHTTLFGLRGVSVCTMEFSGKDKDPEVNILVAFDKKPASENFNHHPFDGTPTHSAIWAGRAMLLQRREPRKIMMILTDGCPDNNAETRAATRRTMMDGIEIAAIGIMDKNVQNFWDNHKIIKSIQDLPVAMFGIMEGLLTRIKIRGG